MNGTVYRIMRHGVLATIDGTPEIGDLFQIYRVTDGAEVVIGTGYIRKPHGPGTFKLQPPETDSGERGGQFPGVQEGDLVRSV